MSTPPFSTNDNPDPGLDPYRELDEDGRIVDQIFQQNPRTPGEDSDHYLARVEPIIFGCDRAKEAGMEPPRKGESFQDYWDRVKPLVLQVEQDRRAKK